MAGARRSVRRSKGRRTPAVQAPPLVVTVDGPSGAGKSSASRLLARRLGWQVFETGGLYRAVAWAVLEAGLDPRDRHAVGRLCAGLPIRLASVPRSSKSAATWRIVINDRRLADQLREEPVSAAASMVAAIPDVRKRLLEFQRKLLQRGRVVMEGRDIGTVVCPGAPVKFFLDAAPSVRGERRFHEQGSDPMASAQRTISAIQERDQRDQGRQVAPLRAADDAVRIDTTNLTLEQVVDKMMAVLKSRGILLSSRRLRRLPRR